MENERVKRKDELKREDGLEKKDGLRRKDGLERKDGLRKEYGQNECWMGCEDKRRMKIKEGMWKNGMRWIKKRNVKENR